MNKSKNVVILDNNNYFVSLKKTFYDNRAKTFSLVPNGYDIPIPEEKEGFSTKWNFEKEEWEYERILSNEEFDLLEQKVEDVMRRDPMYYLKLVRNKLLLETDSLVLKYYQNKKDVPAELRKYREELRDIPTNIENGNLEKPTYVDSVREKIRQVVEPNTLINFDWPKKPDLGEE